MLDSRDVRDSQAWQILRWYVLCVADMVNRGTAMALIEQSIVHDSMPRWYCAKYRIKPGDIGIGLFERYTGNRMFNTVGAPHLFKLNHCYVVQAQWQQSQTFEFLKIYDVTWSQWVI
jgi:hypothetical protein